MRIAILSLFLLLVSIPGISQEKHNETSSDSHIPTGNLNPVIPAQVATKETPQNQEGTTQQQPKTDTQFTWVIAIITFCQLVVAGGQWFVYHRQRIVMQDTLTEIKGQVGLMKRQADAVDSQTVILGQSVAVAQQSAYAAINQLQMVKSKERARLSIQQPGDAYFTSPQSNQVPQESYLALRIGIFNEGPTKAFNVQVKGALTTTVPNETVVEAGWYELVCPEVVGDVPDSNPIEVPLAPVGTWLHFNRGQVKAVEDGDLVLHVVGQIIYDDVFGDHHVTPFHYRWMGERDVAESWPSDCYWDDRTDRSKKT